jgi:glucuronide carrier protein
MFVVAPFIPRIVKAVGKKQAYIGAGVLAVVAAVGIALTPPSLPVLAIVCFGVYGIGLAAVNILMWPLEADTVEYGEWKTGVRTEGTTYAAFSFTRKLGQAVGGAVAAYAIGLGGYVAGAEVQSQGAVDAIRYAAGFVPALFILIAIAIMAKYPLTESTFRTMVGEIAQRRAAAHARTGAR